MPVKVKVKQSGRVKAPRLDQDALTRIGTDMVAEQKLRWSKAINAEGNPAKKLSVRYAIIKQQYLHKRPKRDMKMTGVLVKNFTLRKAIDGVIRAENTSRLARSSANRAQGYEEMIGFAGTDQINIFKLAQLEYGKSLQKAWIPIKE